MNKIRMYCLSLSDSNYEKIKKLGYIPVGLGGDNFNSNWIRDNTDLNISKKNKYYGENTFHYWLWKNKLNNFPDNEWVGFCHYRRFWINQNNNSNKLEDITIKFAEEKWNKFDVILGEEIFVNKTKLSKIIKHGKKILIDNPFIFFNKNKISIKIHFDMYHGYGNLDKAIDLLDKENKEDFREFVYSRVSFNPWNMFICKSRKLMNYYYNSVFDWLSKCEERFGFDEKSYGLIRIYAFLAERYLSYWFQKNSNYKTNPIIHYDIKDY